MAINPDAPITEPTDTPTDEQPVEEVSHQDREFYDSHPELVDLAPHIKQRMGEDKLNQIGMLVVDEYKTDEESRSEWLKMQAEWLRLYYQKDKPLNRPWQGSSEESIPILTEGCQQFHARSYKQFFGAQMFVNAVPVGHVRKEDMDRADRVGRFMSWQLEVLDRNYKRNKDRLLRALPLHGSVFTKVYRDYLTKRNVVENVRAVDMVVSYHNAGINIEDVERKTQIIMMPYRKTQYLTKMKFFSAQPEEYTGTDESSEYQAVIEKATGIQEPAWYTSKRPAKILEQHRWLDIDGDGIEEPYIVWVDAQTSKVLRLSIRYKTDTFGNPTEYKEPLEFFTHYVYLENPDGFYGLGLGHLTGDMNKAANRMLRQIIDAGTLTIARPGFASKSAGIRKGISTTELGKITTIDGMVDDIRKSIMFIDMPGPSNSLMNSLQAITSRADRLNMVTDMLTGQPGAVMQPTQGAQLIEQGLVTFTSVQVRVHASLEQELAKLYRLNSLYLDPVTYFAIQDAQQVAPEQQAVYKEDFAEDLQVRPAFDPMHSTETTKQKKAAMVYEACVKNPLIMNSPKHLAAATRRFFADVDVKNIDEFVPTEQEMQHRMEEDKQRKDQMMQMQSQMAQMKAQLEQADRQIAASEVKVKSTEVENKHVKDQANATIKAWTAQQKVILQRAELMLQAMEHQHEVKQADFDALIQVLQQMQGITESQIGMQQAAPQPMPVEEEPVQPAPAPEVPM